MNTEIQNKLEQLALKRSFPFCYSCYERAPPGRCKTCGSDDLMRELAGEGCEYGTEWIIESILKSELTQVDSSAAFEESIRDCYPVTTKVGWLELDTVTVMKEMDPISWSIAQSEWESQEADEGNIMSFDNGSTYYWTHEVETLLD